MFSRVYGGNEVFSIGSDNSISQLFVLGRQCGQNYPVFFLTVGTLSSAVG